MLMQTQTWSVNIPYILQLSTLFQLNIQWNKTNHCLLCGRADLNVDHYVPTSTAFCDMGREKVNNSIRMYVNIPSRGYLKFCNKMLWCNGISHNFLRSNILNILIGTWKCYCSCTIYFYADENDNSLHTSTWNTRHFKENIKQCQTRSGREGAKCIVVTRSTIYKFMKVKLTERLKSVIVMACKRNSQRRLLLGACV